MKQTAEGRRLICEMPVICILVGHWPGTLPPFDSTRFDVRTVGRDANGLPSASIAEMLAGLPEDWAPDVYYHTGLVHAPIPVDIEEFDGLTVTDARGWHVGGCALWAGAGFFDIVAGGRNAHQILRAQGHEGARFARLGGVNPEVFHIVAGVERDLDVLFVGSLDTAIQGGRNSLLMQLARLSGRCRVLISPEVSDRERAALLNRAKLVFTYSLSGETDPLALEALACGALPLIEEDNAEARELFEGGVHAALYNANNLSEVVPRWLENVEGRETAVEAGRRIVFAEHTISAYLNELFALFESDLHTRNRAAISLPLPERNWRKSLQIYSGVEPAAAPIAVRLLDEAEAEGLEVAHAKEAQAALLGWMAHHMEGGEQIRALTNALIPATRAARSRAASAFAPMTRAFLLLERAQATQGGYPAGKNDIVEAAVGLATAAALCEGADPDESAEKRGDATTSAAPLPTANDLLPNPGFGYPRYGDAYEMLVNRAYLLCGIDDQRFKADLHRAIAWRCHSMLCDIASANGQQEEAYRRAVQAMNVLPHEAEGLIRLGRCAATVGRLDEASDAYTAALRADPFAVEAWPEYVALLNAIAAHATQDAEGGEIMRLLPLTLVETWLSAIEAVPILAAVRPALKAALEANAVVINGNGTPPDPDRPV